MLFYSRADLNLYPFYKESSFSKLSIQLRVVWGSPTYTKLVLLVRGEVVLWAVLPLNSALP
jgi:hypothetical protein